MNWLIWREYRLNRVVLIAGAVLLLLPYLVALIGTVYWYWWGNGPTNGVHPVAWAFGIAAVYSIILSQLTVALLGGNAIAGERADRSAEFIAYLPLRRVRQLGAKLSLAIAAVALVWGANALVLWIVVSTVPGLPREMNLLGYPFMASYFVAITGLTFYGVGWVISSFQSSPTFAVGGGLVVPLILLMSLHAVAWSTGLDWPSTELLVGVGYAIICPILAVVCFLIGTWYYLQRVEP